MSDGQGQRVRSPRLAWSILTVASGLGASAWWLLQVLPTALFPPALVLFFLPPAMLIALLLLAAFLGPEYRPWAGLALKWAGVVLLSSLAAAAAHWLAVGMR